MFIKGVSHSEKTNQQAVLNRLARSCCEALACLAGYRTETPDNDGVQNRQIYLPTLEFIYYYYFSLRAMLTPYICRQMQLAPMTLLVNAPQEEAEENNMNDQQPTKSNSPLPPQNGF